MSVLDKLPLDSEWCTVGYASSLIKNDQGSSVSRQAIYLLIESGRLVAKKTLGEQVLIRTDTAINYQKSKDEISVQYNPVNDVFARFEKAMEDDNKEKPKDSVAEKSINELSETWDTEDPIPSQPKP